MLKFVMTGPLLILILEGMFCCNLRYNLLMRYVPSYIQRTLTIVGGSVTVQLTPCLTGLDLTKQVAIPR